MSTTSMNTTSPAPFTIPPAPPPPEPPGVESPPSAPAPGIVVGGGSHGGGRRRLRAPSLLHPGSPQQAQANQRVVVNATPAPSTHQRIEDVRQLLRQHAKSASPGPALAQMAPDPQAAAMKKQSVGQGPKPAAGSFRQMQRANAVRLPHTAAARARAAQTVRYGNGQTFDPADADATPQMAPGHDPKAIFDQLERTDLG